MLRDRGLLVRESGGWPLDRRAAGLPETVQAIIAARLDTLSDSERAFVQDAAVIGRTAWVGAVCALTERSRWEADELLHVLERKQLLRRARRASVEGETEFAFAHALTQEVAYGQIRRAGRAEKHERAAAWIAALSAEREDRAQLLAHHYATALDLHRQTGSETPELVAATRDAHAEAGRQAQAVSADAAAERHLAAAVALTPEMDPTRVALVVDHARAAYESDVANLELLQTALDAAVTAEDWVRAAQAAQLVATWLDDVGDGPQADAALGQAQAYADRAPYSSVVSEIANLRAYRLLVGGRADEVISLSAETMDRAREAGDGVGSAMMLSWHGDARVSSGDAEGIEEMRRAAAMLEENGHRYAIVVNANLAENLLGLADVRKAAGPAETALRLARRLGTPYQLAASASCSAHIAYHCGDWRTALDLVQGGSVERLGYTDSLRRVVVGLIALGRGEIVAAQQAAEVAIEYAANSKNDEAHLHSLALSTLASAAAGDADLAQSAGAALLDRWRTIGGMLIVTTAVALVAGVPGQERGVAEAAALLPQASGWRPALLAMADRRYADAADVYARIGSLPLEASARMLAASDTRGAEAARQAERALDFYRRVGATAFAQQAEEHLRRSA